jgi:D-alanyl-D-alanine carboxypeptidase/D-alanyl-D-alanine-endopeptidase (penicillin-binding protein 4)
MTASLAVLFLSGCAHSAPARPAPPAAPALKQLQADIDAILGQPPFERTYWGIVVKSLKTGETLYSLNARKLMMPASNMKIVTLAAAAATLGWNYTYETTVSAAGPIDNGLLAGDLIVTGSGDPSLMAADGMADRVFADWASKLRAAGIRVVNGRIVGDDRSFDDEEIGFGWSWDDLQDDYAAGVGALQFNENMARVTVTPGLAVGAPAGIAIDPAGTGLIVDSEVTTAAEGAPAAIRTRRLPGSAHLLLRGTIGLAGRPSIEAVSVDNPTMFFVKSLRTALIANGVDVRGNAVDIGDSVQRSAESLALRQNGSPLVTYRSPPLSELALRLMKTSQNQYAETLLKTMGHGTAAAGRASVASALQPWGVAAADLIQRDGSGLSRYDYVTAEALATVLVHVDRDQTLRAPFQASLPIAGRDGTLSNRMKGTAAEGNAKAKSGSMSNVRGLSGYVTAADGEPLVFSILANNFEMAPAVINAAADAIVVRLATFSRGQS